VEPSGYGATGVVSALAGNSTTSYGNIDGGSGLSALHGGIGVDLSAGSLINEHGAFIKGGSAYEQTGRGYYYGGAGAYLAGGTLTNDGTIVGGSVFDAFGALAGTGVDLTAGTLTNNGSIDAGSSSVDGAFGATVSGGVLINNADITGTLGQFIYGGGVYLNGGTLKTSGTIYGGGGAAVQFGSTPSTLAVEAGAVFNGDIGDFASGDTIDITNLTPAQVSNDWNAYTYTLTTPDDGTLQLGGRFVGDLFIFKADSSGSGTDITVATGNQVISTEITTTVKAGTDLYPSPLYITSTGEVAPTTYGATGVLSNLSTNSVTNYGVIQGGTGTSGSAGGAGGVGVNLSAGGIVVNTGSITGGTGGSGSTTGGSGGSGVLLNGGTLTNSGTISGGAGGSGPTAGAAGDAIKFGTTASTLAVESGAVFNGAIGGFGLNDTVDITNLTPSQVAADFNALTNVLTTQTDGTLAFSGAFAGESFALASDGGSGTDMTLVKGSNISTTVSAAVTLGLKPYPSPLTITASGVVAPSTAGATGVLSNASGNSMTNHGAIHGGTGTAGGTGGSGGVGALFRGSGDSLTNTGSITGGTGGTGSSSRGGTGGVALNLSGGGSGVNTGSITGGTGGTGSTTGGIGGVGVAISGATLTTSGTISGGAGGSGATSGASGAAVNFGTAASTLVVDSGAVFNGAISGFGLNDTVDITNLTPTQVQGDFNDLTNVLTTGTDGTLAFSGAFAGESFVFASDGGSGTDVTVIKGSIISTTISAAVTLGLKPYPSPLTITASGVVAPSTAGATGVLSNASGNSMTNNGAIHGGTGTSGSVGGTGGTGAIFRGSGGSLKNIGSITGGTGGTGSSTGGGGGTGVLLDGSTLTTSGTISGGAGGSGPTSGASGNAVSFGTAASTLVVDSGAVFNGAIGGFGLNDKVDITNLTPSQVEGDFNDLTNVLTTGSDGTLAFSGAFTGESFAFASDGGSGTDITLINGSIISTTISAAVTLGQRPYPSPLTITTTGVVTPSTAGATGVLSNLSGNSLTNNGAINGGTGTSGSSGGTGGTGALFHGSGDTLTNTGSITGGAGGTGSTTGGAGGIGVVISGGTLTTSGTISGGAGGSGPTSGVSGNAVNFGTAASTLVVDSGAAFNGAIGGFGLNDTVDITNLTPTQVQGDFNSSTHVLTTGTDGTLAFSGAFAGESFVFASDHGSGTDVTLIKNSPGAAGSMAPTVAALTPHMSSIDGFGLNANLARTDLSARGATANFNASTEILAIAHGATTNELGFTSVFTGEPLVFSANGSGSDLTLQSGAAADLHSFHGASLLASAAHSVDHTAHILF
jgi:hypothetical protein